METHETIENPEIPIKSDMVILILAFISLFILNWQIQTKLMIMLAGMILIFISGFGLTTIFFPHQKDMGLLSRIIVSPIIGIFLAGFWSIFLGLIFNYTAYNTTDVYYGLIIVPILILMFSKRIFRILKTKKAAFNFSKREKTNKSLGKPLKLEKNEKNYLTSAQLAAKAEKEKLMKIKGNNGKTENVIDTKTLKGSDSKTFNKRSLNSKKPFASPMPRPVLKNKSRENELHSESTVDLKNNKSNQSNKNKNFNHSKSNKSKWAFKSQENTKIDSPEKIEIIKVRKSSKDLIMVLLLTLLSGMFIFLPLHSSMVKLPFIVLLIFFIFGYSVLAGVFTNFSDKGLLKKIISSILVSVVLTICITSSLTLLKIHIPSNYIFAAIIATSSLMVVLGYFRRVRKQKSMKKSFGHGKQSEISEKNELNVLSLSSSKTSPKSRGQKSFFNRNNSKKKSSFNPQNSKNNRNNSDIENINHTNGFPKKRINLKNSDEKELPEKKFDKNENNDSESKKSLLTPSDARNLVISRKKEKERLNKENIAETSRIYDEIDSADNEFKRNRSEKLKSEEKPETYSKTPVQHLTPLKFIIVIILSVVGFIVTLPSISNSILTIFNSNTQLSFINLIFAAPVLLYLPGYALKELFLRNKFSGMIFNTTISVAISLSLDIILAFVLLYLGHYYNEINLTLSLYIGILSAVSIIGISIRFLKSNYKNRASYSINVDNEAVNNIKNSKKEINNPIDIPVQDKIQADEKTTSNTGKSYQELNPEQDIFSHDINSKTVKEPVFTLNKRSKPISGDKPVQRMYMEEDLEKSFSSLDVFESKKSHDNDFSKEPGYYNPNKTNKRPSYPVDLLIVSIITILTIISIYTPFLSKTPINSILGLLFVIFIPGYVLVSALFPKKNDLENIERVALSFGLSLAISPLIGLALNYTPFGTKLTPIVISLIAFTLVMTLLAYIRRKRMAEEDRFQPDISGYLFSLKKSFKSESGLDKILSIILIISLVLAVATTAYIIVKPKEGEKFTEFYILGPNGKASDYPTNLTLGQSGKLYVGVVNHEYSTVNYKVVVKLQGNIIDTEQITLKDNQKWENEVIFTPDVVGTKQNLEFNLYKLPDDKKVYRSLHLWVNVA